MKNYELKNIIELDGAVFGKRETWNQTEVPRPALQRLWLLKKQKKKRKNL